MSAEDPNYIAKLVAKNQALERGEVAASRAHSVELLPEGKVKRTKLDPEKRRKTRARAYAARNWVAALRHELDLSQPAFADDLKISIHTLRNWESEKTQPSGAAETLLRTLAAHPEIFEVVRESNIHVHSCERAERPRTWK